MHPNQATLEKFHTAFVQLDADTMATCYAADAAFDDEAFSLRDQAQVVGMWRMLCETTKAKERADWRLVHGGVEAYDTTDKAHRAANLQKFMASKKGLKGAAHDLV